ncbi:hypothetical protein SLEP1_g38144 [Rubroshorea leprosula]|uniref:Uncharacterized protein n=1 Tax=Rubroshorea leprosula TaxID=152421 RepID=A0AAV5KWX8_9ROSI|nr:hypothetical protein SLEP1_g38144 [Rubroshorea leprosula]
MLYVQGSNIHIASLDQERKHDAPHWRNPNHNIKHLNNYH